MIVKAMIQSYDSANHQVTVQTMGSMPTYWPAVPVARSIPGSDCSPGTMCAVMPFSRTDPTDAVVIATFTGAGDGEPYTPPPSAPTAYDGGTAASMSPWDYTLDGAVAGSTYGATEYVDAGVA